MKKWSTREILQRIAAGSTMTVIGLSAAVYLVTKQWTAVVVCLLTAGVMFLWAFFLVRLLKEKLTFFSEELCMNIDRMMEGKESSKKVFDEDTLLDRITFRLTRLYQSLQTAKNQIASERADLQKLISDVSHQIKTPTTNLKLASGALLEQELAREDQLEYLQIISNQVDKLHFLMNAMVKSSRLETGVIALVKKSANLYDTLAAAVNGIFPSAQEKQLHVTVSGLETLVIPHDSRWTAEALFNILDNAVKYTPCGGTITVSMIQWESYTKIEIEDNGKGIHESRQAAIFGRFYREPEVHEIDGLGIGLYLTREIIAKQGGYVKVTSQPDCGCVFSVFLPNQT